MNSKLYVLSNPRQSLYTVGHGMDKPKQPSVIAFVDLSAMKQFNAMVRAMQPYDPYTWDIKHMPRNNLYHRCRAQGHNILIYTRTKKWIQFRHRDGHLIVELI